MCSILDPVAKKNLPDAPCFWLLSPCCLRRFSGSACAAVFRTGTEMRSEEPRSAQPVLSPRRPSSAAVPATLAQRSQGHSPPHPGCKTTIILEELWVCRKQCSLLKIFSRVLHDIALFKTITANALKKKTPFKRRASSFHTHVGAHKNTGGCERL